MPKQKICCFRVNLPVEDRLATRRIHLMVGLAVLFLSMLWVSACSPPATVKYSGSGGTGKKDADADLSADSYFDDSGSSSNENCQVEDGDQACEAGFFCAAFDGDSARCFEDHSRMDSKSCTDDVQCASFRCNQVTDRCAASPGAACTIADGCGPGDDNTANYVCIDGICEGSTGENDEPCNENADCLSGICKDNVCVGGEAGEDCRASEHCQSSICVAGTCSNGDIGDSCEYPADCQSNACKDGQCVEGNAGDDCTESEHCQHGFCKDDQCADGNTGDECSEPEHCQSTYCVNEICSDGEEGDDCEKPGDCKSGECVNNVCTGDDDGDDTGRVCVTDEQCIGKECIDGRCRFGGLGSTCRDNNDCDGDLKCNRQCLDDLCASACTDGRNGSPCITGQACANAMVCNDHVSWPVPGIVGMELDTCIGEEPCDFHIGECFDTAALCLRSPEGSFCGRPNNGAALSPCTRDKDCALGVCSDHGFGNFKCAAKGGWGTVCVVAILPDIEPTYLGCSDENPALGFKCDTTLPTPHDDETPEGIDYGYCGASSGYLCYTRHVSTNTTFNHRGGCAVGGIAACVPSVNTPSYCEHDKNLACNTDKKCACDGVELEEGEVCELDLVPGRRCLTDHFCP